MNHSSRFVLGLLAAASGLFVYACSSSDSTPAETTTNADAGVTPTPTPPPASGDAGTRTCSGSQTLCPASDNCVDLQLDRENCGACGKACAPSEVCSQGTCGLTCGGGTTKCGANCADTKTDEKNCGACGNVCGTGQTCAAPDGGAPTCTCPAGTTAKGTSCVDLQTDTANCGTLNNACAAGIDCISGACRQPVAWYKFEGNLNDVTGNNNGALDTGTETYADTSYATTAGKALVLDGSTNILVATPMNLPLGKSPRTIEAWVRATAFQDGTFNGILSYGVRTCNGNGQLLSMQGDYRLSSANWCNDLLQGSSARRAQAWSHVAYIWDGTERSLWVDGQRVSVDLPPVPFDTQTGDLRIGSTDDPGRYFKGQIDDVKIWDYARSAARMAAASGDQSIAYAFTAATDMTDSGPLKLSSGTKNAVTATADHKNAANSALAFDGVDNTQVKIYPVSALGKTRAYSMSIWVKATAAAQGTFFHTSSQPDGGGWCVSMLGLDANGKPTATSWDGSGYFITADNAIAAATWTHVAVTHSGSTMKLYVNGVLAKSVDRGYIGSNQPDYLTLGTSKVDGTANGCSGSGSIGGNFTGSLDEARVWDRELSAVEVAAEFAR